jgi:gluconolactonase
MVKTLAADVKNPEGPVSLADGSWIVTEMDIGAITHVSCDGKTRRVIAATGLPNGLAIDLENSIWVADAKRKALLRVAMNGTTDVVSTGGEPDPFLLPNDLCFGPDGMIYMTDSGKSLDEFRAVNDPAEAYDMTFDGRLYRIDPRTGEARVLDRGFRLTNGICIGPGGEFLYLAETLSGNIYRYKFGEWNRMYFGNVMAKPPREFGKIAGPDGMAFDSAGNLYVAVIEQGDITVLDPMGRVSGRIALPGSTPTNLAFDVTGKKRMLITEASRGELLLMDTPEYGLPLYM